MRLGFALSVVIGVAIIAALLLLPGTYACAFYWQKTDAVCTFIEIANKWQTLITGVFALLAAAATVRVIASQVRQADRHREQNRRDEARNIAEALTIDLGDTFQRSKAVKGNADINPPMSEMARGLIREATKVHPALAVALQRHCSEIGLFTSRISQTGVHATVQSLTRQQTVVAEGPLLAYRARVLGWCFGCAVTKIEKTGRAEGPFIDKKDIEQFEKELSDELGRPVGGAERLYLTDLFNTTGGIG
ncbi:MAG: hypothetical protein EOS85_11565 [Mesorhizobium sp.]|nr:MAG: hypothetical protein EOS85_11565 [Mesorhizobium sp.]